MKIKNELQFAIEKHSFDRDSIMTLYRLLEVRHRQLHPLSGEDYIVDPQLEKQLRKEICSFGVKIFSK